MQEEIKPLVSVILPVYNAATFLEECIQSILTQTYKHIEIIAIDDFSKDDSFSILKKLAKDDTRLHVAKNVKRYGMAVTLNRALRKAKGKFITFGKAEDVFLKFRFEKQLSFLLSNDKVVGIGTQCVLENESKKEVGKSEFPLDNMAIYKKPLDGVTLQFETVMINKYRIPKDVLYFHTNKIPFIYSDLYVKLLQYGELRNLPEVLSTHRILANDIKRIQGHIPSVIRLWFRAETLFDYRPSLRYLFSSFIRPRIS